MNHIMFKSEPRGSWFASLRNNPNKQKRVRVGGILRLIIVLCLTGLALIMPDMTLANTAAPFVEGESGTEPIGIETIRIQHETLRIDMRSLRSKGPVEVEAIYELVNDGAPETLDLLFITGQRQVDNFQVWLGDQAIAMTPRSDVKLPPNWEPPLEMPGLDGDEKLTYFGDVNTTSIGFTLDLPSGSEELKVRYQADAAQSWMNSSVRTWQFVYILAPGRTWADFGTLDISIDVPRGWEANTKPELSRTGSTLTGQFDGVPADALTITTRMVYPWLHRPLQIGTLILYGVILLAGPVFSVRHGIHDARRLFGGWVRGLAVGFIWGISLIVMAWAAAYLPDALLLGEQASPGYGQIYMVFFGAIIGIAAIPVGLILTVVSAFVAHWWMKNHQPHTSS